MNREFSIAIPLAAALLCLAFVCHEAKAAGLHQAATALALAGGAVAFAMTKYLLAPRDRLVDGEVASAQARERLIADFSSDVHLCLNADLTVAAINPAVKRHWGYDSGQLLGKHILDVVAEVDRAAVREVFSARKMEFESSLQRFAGGFIDTLWQVEYSNADGRCYCAVTDISERKNAQRMKQRLFAMIGHDLRAPLASARMALSTIPAHEKLPVVDGLLSRVIALSNDMLDLQQAEDGKLVLKKQVIEVSSVIDEVLAEFAALAENAQQTLESTAAEFLVEGDEERIKQIVANFVSNAVKYAGAEAKIEVTASELGDVIELAVSDNGPGIPSSLRSLLFEPYARLDEAGGKDGRGLGLALCRFLAVAQGGTVGVRSSESGGACFWLRLPKGRLDL